MYSYEKLRELDCIYKEEIKSCRVIGEIILDERELKDLCREISKYSHHLLMNTFDNLILVLSCNIAYYYYNESGFWKCFFDLLNIEETQQLRATIGEKIEHLLVKLNLLKYKRKGPFRYVGAILEQTGITKNNMEAYVNLVTYIVNSHGIKNAREIPYTNYQKIIQNAYISKTLKAYLLDEAGWDFNQYVIKMIDYYTNQSFTIKEIESFKGVHPKFWSEFMKYYTLANSERNYNSLFEIPPRFMFDINSMKFYIKFPSKKFRIYDKSIVGNITTYVFNDAVDLNSSISGDITLPNGITYNWFLEIWDYRKENNIYFNKYGEYQKKISNLNTGEYIVVARNEEEIPYGNVIRHLGIPNIKGLSGFNVYEVRVDSNDYSDMYPFIYWENTKSRLEISCFYDVFIKEIPNIKINNACNYDMSEFCIFYNIGNGIKRIYDINRFEEFFNEVNKQDAVIGEVWIDSLINNRNFYATKLRFCKLPRCKFDIQNMLYVVGQKLQVVNDCKFISLSNRLKSDKTKYVLDLQNKYFEGKITINKNIILFEKMVEWVDVTFNNDDTIKEYYYSNNDNLIINIKGIFDGNVKIKLKNERDEILFSKPIKLNDNNEYSYSLKKFFKYNELKSFNILKIVIEYNNQMTTVNKVIYNAEALINQYYKIASCKKSMKIIEQSNNTLYRVFNQINNIMKKQNCKLRIVDSSCLKHEIVDLYRSVLMYSEVIDKTILVPENLRNKFLDKSKVDINLIKALNWYSKVKKSFKNINKNDLKALLEEYKSLEVLNIKRWKNIFEGLKVELENISNKEEVIVSNNEDVLFSNKEEALVSWKKEVEFLKRFSLKSEIFKMDKGRELSYAWIDYLKGNEESILNNLDKSEISKDYIVRDLSCLLKIIIYLRTARIGAFNAMLSNEFKDSCCKDLSIIYKAISSVIFNEKKLDVEIDCYASDKLPLRDEDKKLIKVYSILIKINKDNKLTSNIKDILYLMTDDWKIQLLVNQYLKINHLNIEILNDLRIDRDKIPKSPEITKILEII